MRVNTQGSTAAYDRGYKWLHWIMAALILLMMFALVGFSGPLTEEERTTMLIGHSSIGTIISVLLLVRVFKRFIKKDPVPTQSISKWQHTISKSVQYGLYVCMIWVPLSGYITARFHELPVQVFGNFMINQSTRTANSEALFETVRQIHVLGIYTLLTLLALHIGGAIYHRMVKKDDVMATMTSKRA